MDDSWMKQDRPLILVTNQAHPDALAVLAGFARIDANPAEAPWPRAELFHRAAGADGLLAFMTDHVDDEFLAHCPNLRAIGCALKGRIILTSRPAAPAMSRWPWCPTC